MLQPKPWSIRSLLLGGAAILLSACATQAPASTSSAAGATSAAPAAGQASQAAPGNASAIVIAQVRDATKLDPSRLATVIDRNIMANVFDPLIHRKGDGSLVGVLAEKWDRTSDTTWRFSLRHGVKFQNEEPFNAQAVKVTLDRIRDGSISETASTYRTIKAVNVVDDYTVDVETTTPDPLMPSRVADLAFIIPPGYLKEKGDDYLLSNPVGTGPYRFVQWVRGDRIELEANPSYWRGAPKIQKVTFRVIGDDTARVAALRTGGVDIAADVPPSTVDSIKQQSTLRVSEADSSTINFVGFNFNPDIKSPVQDKRVRQALNYAVDRDAIVKAILAGSATPVGQPMTPSTFGFAPEVKPYPSDIAKAKALLAEAGYPDGFSVEMSFPTGIVVSGKEVAEAVAGQFAKVGVKVSIQQMEWAAFNQKGIEGTISPLFLSYIRSSNFDADQILTNAVRTKGAFNFGRYSNTEVDARTEKAGTLLDQAERSKLYGEIAQITSDDPPWVYLHSPKVMYGVNSKLAWEAVPDNIVFVFDDVSTK
jgi:peptide/nickel transport system substrate-binding protein